MLKNLNLTFIVAAVGLIIIAVGFFYPSEGLITISNIFMMIVIFMVIRNSRNRKKKAASQNYKKNEEDK